ncbi:MAG: pseudouridine synthase [Verrucomicrobiota bacterium]
MRLDRFLIRRGTHSCREVAGLLADGMVRVDGRIETSGKCGVSRFSHIELRGKILQAGQAIYLMLHKPAGYLSATSDPQHPTVMELIDHPLRDDLHLAGRLDRASTGLLLLTNDGRWSKAITGPEKDVPKVYRVTTRDVIAPETVAHFENGIYFAWEDLTTQPAQLEILGERVALLTLHEGRYHQVKRMFHAVGNRVLSLHRERIGPLLLDEGLPEGKFRELTPDEVASFATR